MALTFREATLHDVRDVVRISNDAFMADAFFKKPEFIIRFNEDTVRNMISNPAENGVFLVASDDGGSSIVGSIHVEPVRRLDSDQGGVSRITGGFSAVSVPESHGKRGIGSFLVASAEEYVLSVARQQFADIPTAEVCMQMGVVNVREDLFSGSECARRPVSLVRETGV
eukprot:CAMPEP_0114449670 /NCGR_PEP_ID=MMETSP0104-20121206/56_1 /TAXON_ID=37642 ORGANISM="Paraphysomonas imperforata, Strain PA2" /NCGR_SAMPLE_ID=MMETSP0104 /ASSEMBLY_ACC=CAM_ASM_000202 /LENGTH=168 /DNA_ID=CAMNT_0001621771 /DNA_START=199 /DNA_END=705 /DNA_ORIENTATION=-